MASECLIIGAESTGKSTLAVALGKRADTIILPEVLRQWCMARHRTPSQAEQLGLLEIQARALRWSHHWAQARGKSWVVCDAGSWMTALYSELFFADESLWALLRPNLRTDSHIVWVRPSGVWRADGIMRESPGSQHRVDAAIEKALQWQLQQGWISPGQVRQWRVGQHFEL